MNPRSLFYVLPKYKTRYALPMAALLLLLLIQPGRLAAGHHHFDIDARTTLGATTTLMDRYLSQALTSLRLIAHTPTARSGIWPEIKPKLELLQAAVPGAALYIEPDGGYYSVEQGYTGLNLADREYFPRLFAGEEIHGSLIYSRSTGKQSVIMAVPVSEGDQVTGAVALSIFLDEFQQLISQSLNLPSGYLWYVINEEGNTVLHPRTDFVFMNPAQQGGPSLSKAVETIVSQEQGATTYQFAGRNTHVLFSRLSFNNWRLVIGKIGEELEDAHMPMAYEILQELQTTLSGKLREMDRHLQQTVDGFGGRLPRELVARNALKKLYDQNPYVISCALIDTNGEMMFLEPPDYRPMEGGHIRDHEDHFIMQKNQMPMLSNSYLAGEGFDAVSLKHPIIDEKGNFHGSVSLLIRPEVMIEELATPHIAETIYQPWVMEPEGRILFDKAFGGTGRMLFLDYRFEGYETLLELGDRMAEEKSGQGDYVYIDPENNERVIQIALWDTIELHNTQWRLVISYPPYE